MSMNRSFDCLLTALRLEELMVEEQGSGCHDASAG